MDDPQESPRDIPEIEKQSISSLPRRNHRRRLWLFVIPLLAWLACLGLAVKALSPLVPDTKQVFIPLTGGDGGALPGRVTQTPKGSSTPTAAVPADPKRAGAFLDVAQQRLDTCASSFHDYFVLEQVVVDQPDTFNDPGWRSDATDAMQAFREDCAALGTLPAAPAALGDIDHWLKLAAGEVGPASDSFTTALDKNETDQFRASVRHLIKFVDYIHNAEGAMDGLKQRKEI